MQLFNNADLSIPPAHRLCNRDRVEDREISIRLFGYHQPRQLAGKPNSKLKRDRCKLHDLLHA